MQNKLRLERRIRTEDTGKGVKLLRNISIHFEPTKHLDLKVSNHAGIPNFVIASLHYEVITHVMEAHEYATLWAKDDKHLEDLVRQYLKEDWVIIDKYGGTEL